MNCPDEKQLSLYVDDPGLSESERGNIEEHLSKCSRCLDLVLVASQSRKKSKKLSLDINNKIKSRLGLRLKKQRPDLKWLLGAIIFFALSFIVKRYFMQFLFASVVLGFKWVMEGDAARRIIMIFKKMPEEEKFERRPLQDVPYKHEKNP